MWAIVEARLVLQGRAGARVSPRTLESYRQGLSALLRWAQPAGVSLLRPRPDEGSAYARWLEGQKYSPSTVNVRLAAARSVYAALRWAGATEASPFSDVRGASDPTPRWEKRSPYTKAEIDTLLKHADPQERVYVLLGADCGLRNSEMSSLRREDVPERRAVQHHHPGQRGAAAVSGPLAPGRAGAEAGWPRRRTLARGC